MLICTPITPVMAESKSSVTNIAEDFVSRVNKKLQAVEEMEEKLKSTSYSISNMHIRNEGMTDIPDGEILVLNVQVGKHKILLDYDVLGVKDKGDIFVSLHDFFLAVDFAISVDQEKKIASGWFIRENQNLLLDVNHNSLIIAEQEAPLENDYIKVIDGELYASSQALSEWFGMNFSFDFSNLVITLFTSQPIPAEERYARRHKNKAVIGGIGSPQFALHEEEYRAYSLPFMDVNLRSSYLKREDGGAKQTSKWSMIGAGDLAYFNNRFFIDGDEQDLINNLRLSFEKQDEDGQLLGPLKAKEIMFGDISTTPLRLTGGGRQEQGIRISNGLRNETISEDVTDFIGDAQPGWDIELYRNNSLVEFNVVDVNGQYRFDDVQLFAGDNDFRFVFYGPHGEIQEEQKSINVGKSQIFKNKGLYDISLTRNNIVTFSNNIEDEINDGEPHLVAKYEYGLTDKTSINTGVRSRQEDLDRRTYLQAGLSSTLYKAIVNANLAYETTEGGMAIEATARRNLRGHFLRAKGQFNTSDYITGSNKAVDPVIINTNIAMTGPIRSPFLGLKPNYSLSSTLLGRKSKAFSVDLVGTLNTRIGNTHFTDTVSFSRSRQADGLTRDVLSGSANMRGFYNLARWRLRTNYNIYPDFDVSELLANVSYPFTPDVEGLAELSHTLNPSKTKGVVSANWKAEKATVSPSLSYDTEGRMEALVNVRFGVGRDPRSHSTHMYNQRISSSGGVSARIFLDLNGNGIFDEGEEALKGIELEAIHARKRAISNDKGIAFLPNLSRNRLTDIRLDPSSFDDPYWMPSREGISVRPRPGIVTEVDFPIVVSGEIDGTVSLRDSGGRKSLASQYKLHLYRPDGTIEQSTSTTYDGFYIFNTVRPGVYYLTVDKTHARNTGFARPLPQKVLITPEGTTLYGQDITLPKGRSVSYEFFEEEGVSGRQEKIDIKLGPFSSRLSMVLSWYKLQLQDRSLAKKLNLLIELPEIERSKRDHMYYIPIALKKGESGSDYQRMCQDLENKKYTCLLEILTY